MSSRPKRPGVLATIERLLNNDSFVLIAFSLLLASFGLNFYQYILAVIIFEHFTTKAPQWLEKESKNAISKDIKES